MSHAEERIRTRIAEIGLTTEQQEQLWKVAQHLAKTSTAKSEAFRLFCLEGQHGQAYGSKSNGNQVWLIVRDQTPATVMFRRDGQPTDNLRVDQVTIVN